ncbi:MAG: hypothetical protein ACOH2V_01200 [Candidatus Saccharimonadaceae bacterium]
MEVYPGEELLKAVEEIEKRKIVDPITGKKKLRPSKDVIVEIQEFLGKSPIYNKDLLVGILTGTGRYKDKLKSMYEAIKADTIELDKFLKLKKKYNDKISAIKSETTDFEQMNHMWDAVIEQIKQGNLDSELFELLKVSYNNSLNEYLKVDKNKIFNTDELLTLLSELDENQVATIQKSLEIVDDYYSNIVSTVTKDEVEKSLASIRPDIVRIKLEGIVNSTTDEDLILGALRRIQNIILPGILSFKKTNAQDFNILVKSQEFIDDPSKFVSNSIYDFIKDFDVSLNDNEKQRKEKLFDILKREEYALSKTSDISNYLSDGVNVNDIQQAVNTLKLMKTVVSGMSTTVVSMEDPVGFIATRQQFAKANKTGSKVLGLKTITSDMATMMISDLDRIINKLGFLKILLLNNSGKIFVEQETIRRETNTLLLTA